MYGNESVLKLYMKGRDHKALDFGKKRGESGEDGFGVYWNGEKNKRGVLEGDGKDNERVGEARWVKGGGRRNWNELGFFFIELKSVYV